MRSFVLTALAALVLCALPGVALAQISGPTVITPDYQGESPSLVELAALLAEGEIAEAVPGEAREVLNPMINMPQRTPGEEGEGLLNGGGFDAPDPLWQTADGTEGSTPAPGLSFEGTSDDDNAALLGFRVVPPDTEGDVGRKYYAQMNNLVFEIFSKKTGASTLGPLPNTIFWTGTGTACEVYNDGDPVVLYDHQAKRWIFSQFAILDFQPALGQFVSHQCFAVSKTSDPLGAYYLYDFITAVPTFTPLAAFNDYPKLGIWPDGIYYTANDFEWFPGFSFTNVSAIAFDKWAMYKGDPAIGVQYKLGPVGATDEIFISLLPSHWEGHKNPKKGAPNIFWQMFDSEAFTFSGDTGPDGVLHWAFKADFDTPANSTFTPLGLIPTPEYESYVCSGAGRNCVDQPSPGTVAEGNGLDTIDFRLMFRAQYRSFGDDDSDEGGWFRGRWGRRGGNDDSDDDSDSYDSVVLSATVDADGEYDPPNSYAGVRWFEMRKAGGGWGLHQAGTYAPVDGVERFMPSIAQNKEGTIAVGYTASGELTYPAVRYATREKDDPLGILSGGEMSCHEGTGSQINSANRWGDYATVSVDPLDDCTFWYTHEYYEETGAFDFKTRICKIPCEDDDSDDDSDEDSD